MKLKPSLLAAAAAAALLAGPAHAAPYAPGSDFGALDNNVATFAGGAAGTGVNFTYTYTFSLLGTGSVLGGALNVALAPFFNITGLTFTLTGPGNVTYTDSKPDPLEYFFAGVPSGSYTFTVAGTTAGTAGGSYFGTLGAVTAPVPEPGTMAMVLAGLGVLGWVSRRRLGRRD